METHGRTTRRRRRVPVAPPTYFEDADEPADAPVDAPAWLAVSRAVALFFGSFTLLNVFGEIRHPGFDANIWWIDLRPFPVPAARGALSFAGVLMVAFALRPSMSSFRRRITIAVVLVLFGATLWNAFVFYALWKRGQITTHFAVPFSLHVAASLAVVVAGLVAPTDGSPRPGRDFVLGVLTLLVCLVGFPIAQMSSFGNTDYRREADVIVVFGCRAYADGSPSSALLDRVTAGCELYRQGLAHKLILSGAAGDNNVHEADVMRAEAIRLGVPEADILIDPLGVDTQASVKNTVAMFEQLSARRVLAVSHFYHLPRIKLAYHRAGIEVFTVPAKQRQPLQRLLEFELREVGALWYYYLEPLTKG